jgi:surface antigen
MRAITKSTCSLVLALNLLLGGSALAAVAPPDSRESVTVTGKRTDLDAMKADLDPTRDHFGGLTGEKIARDIDPLDRYSAFHEFARGLAGPLGESYDWYGLRDNGRFRPTREFYEAGLLCRDFVEETDHRGEEDGPGNAEQQSRIQFREPILMGTACRENDGWHFR